MIDYAGIRMTQGQLISCEEKEGVNDNMTKSHFHDFYELYYLVEGGRHIIVEGLINTIEPGMFAIKAPYVMHHSFGSVDVPFKRIVLYFKPGSVESEALAKALINSTGIYKPSSKDSAAIHNLLKLILREENSSNIYKEELLRSLLNILLITILRQAPNKERSSNKNLIGDIIDYIHNNYFEDISLETLSKKFFVSPYYLCREFKRITNRTIVQYINITRVSNAQRKIMETNKSITEISHLTGFSNLTHFNRVFKKYSDMTPSEYRRKYKKVSKG
ncbi:MAG: AraC family transcriptional regulator [Clostridiaceae bacterium]